MRRFGRNQRRRAREQIATLGSELQASIEHAQVLDSMLKGTEQNLREALGEIEEAKALLPSFSAALQAEVIRLGGEVCREIEVPLAPSLDFATIDAAPIFLRRVRLPVIVAAADCSELSQHIHAQVEFASHRLAYAVSEATLLAMPRKHRLRRLTEVIASAMAPELEAALRRGPRP